MSLDHWLMLLLTPRWLTLCVRDSSSPKPQAMLALLPHLLLASSAGCRSHSCSQETATSKPNLLIPARAGCDDFGSNGKLHHMATLPSAQLSGEGPHLAALRRLSCLCFAQLDIWRLAYYTSDADRPCTKGAINSRFSIQGNLSSDKFFPKYEINQPTGAHDTASASSSESSAVQVAIDTVPQILMSISHLCDPTILARFHVISAHFTQQARKINTPILSFKYNHCLWVPKKTPNHQTYK